MSARASMGNFDRRKACNTCRDSNTVSLSPWSSLLLLLSAVQPFVSFGLLNYFFPLFPLLSPLFPFGHPHLPQTIPHIVFPTYSWPSLRSCCIRFPFVYGLNHSFISHSFYMPQPAQSYVFYVSYYIFIINCFFQFFICFESPLSVCLLCWAKYPSQYLPFEYQSFLLHVFC